MRRPGHLLPSVTKSPHLAYTLRYLGWRDLWTLLALLAEHGLAVSDASPDRALAGEQMELLDAALEAGWLARTERGLEPDLACSELRAFLGLPHDATPLEEPAVPTHTAQEAPPPAEAAPTPPPAAPPAPPAVSTPKPKARKRAKWDGPLPGQLSLLDWLDANP